MIDRRSVIRKAIETFAREQLFTVRHYPPDKLEFLDAYPTHERMNKRLDKNYIAIGYGADDGGRQAELGSSLKRRRHICDFYVFGISRVWAENVASVLQYSLESEQSIVLLDPSDGSTVIGHVDVEFVSAQEVKTRTPRPWEENVWVTRLRVIDFYNSSGGG